MRHLISFFLFLFIPSFIFSQYGSEIILSEIMFRPSGSHAEFIEVYNTSQSKSVDLTGFHLKYHSSSAENIVEFNGGGTILAPNQYAVIFENDYDVLSGVYSGIVPNSALILKIEDNTFGGGMSNSSDRTVQLLNNSNEVISEYTYTADNASGISDEKISMVPDNSSSNWANTNQANGTPGAVNTTVPPADDLGISKITFNPDPVFSGDDLYITAEVSNYGTNAAAGFTVEIFNDSNNNNIPDAGELLKSENFTNLNSSESINSSTTVSNISLGNHSFIVVITYAGDLNVNNNQSSLNITVNPTPTEIEAVIINEIMYAPSSGQPEWIELYNQSSSMINLRDWSLADASSQTTISSGDFFLNPGEYLVLSDNANITNFFNIPSQLISLSLPSLNNSGDELSLKDQYDRNIDFVQYISSWGGTSGWSLERIDFVEGSNDADNWGTTISNSKGTPGSINSLSPKDFDLGVTSIFTNPSYVTVSSSFEITSRIENLGRLRAQNFEVKMYLDTNFDKVPQESEKIFQQSYNNLASNNYIDATVALNNFSRGSYTILTEITFNKDQFAGNDLLSFLLNVIPIPNLINDVVINEFMYDPNSGEPEWIELYNRTNSAINLNKWLIGDGSSLVEITDRITIPGKGYLVISDNISIINNFSISSELLVLNLPALNNSGDEIKLIDSLGRSIDALSYNSGWGGDGGYSLERIDAFSPSNNQSNWGTTQTAKMGTPGGENYLTPKDYDLEVVGIDIMPNKIFTLDSIMAKIEIRNIGKSTAENFDVSIYLDSNLNDIAEDNELLAKENFAALNAGEAIEILYNHTPLSKGSYQLIGNINFTAEEKPEDNFLLSQFEVEFASEYFNDVIINEIMYKPNDGEPEWVELYNRTNRDIDLNKWTINKKLISSSQLIIPAEGYIVISESDVIRTIFDIPSRIKVMDLPSLSDEGYELILADSHGREIESVPYSPGWGLDSEGTSLERVDTGSISTSAGNWSSSRSRKNATPGKENSVVQKLKDLWVKSISIQSQNILEGGSTELILVAENRGLVIAENFSVIFYDDINNDKILGNDEIIFRSDNNLLQIDTESTFSFIYENVQSGNHTITAVVDYVLDDRQDDNTLTASFLVNSLPYNPGSVVVNEIMYKPKSGNPEWVEIFNRSDKEINLLNWTISDKNDLTVIVDQKFILQPGEYLALAGSNGDGVPQGFQLSSSMLFIDLPSLNNDGDEIVIKDSYGTKIDSVSFLSEWGGDENGISLERINIDDVSTEASNWSSSRDPNGSSMGIKNSIVPNEYDLKIVDIKVLPTWIYEKGTATIKTGIANISLNDAHNFVVKIYNDRDSNLLVSESDSIIFSDVYNILGKNDTLSILTDLVNFPIGSHQLVVSIQYESDNDITNNEASLIFDVIGFPNTFNDIVINEIMYKPENGLDEWVELINTTDTPINIKDWKVGDNSNLVVISDVDKFIQPNHYLILSSNPTITDLYPIDSEIIILKLPSLNNRVDELIIKDQLGILIDSVKYKFEWGGSQPGTSLERIDAIQPSDNASNWSSCVLPIGATPGTINSISKKDFDLEISEFTFEQPQAFINSEVVLSIKVKNNGKNQIADAEVFINFNGLDFPEWKISIQNLNKGESLLFSKKYTFSKVGNFKAEAICEFLQDQFKENNSAMAKIEILENPNAFGNVAFNEIMYNPKSNEPEWFEFINTSETPINIKDWRIHDNSSSVIISEVDKYIQPNQYFILSSSEIIKDIYSIDSEVIICKLPSLNNSGDNLKIIDRASFVIDSVNYVSDWGGSQSGKSLEKLDLIRSSNDADNWSSSESINGATPGKINSVSEKEYDLALIDFHFTYTRLFIDDSVELFVEIKNLGAHDIEEAEVNIKFNSVDISSWIFTVKNFEKGESQIFKRAFSFSEPGVYSANCEVIFVDDQFKENNFGTSDVIVEEQFNEFGDMVLSEIMYAPNSGEPEWLELFNQSKDTINISNWMIGDMSTVISLPENEISILPDSFVVISANESIKSIFDINSPLIITDLPSFNNSGDQVIIFNNQNLLVDSMEYKSSWGGRNGKSLEKIDLNLPAIDINNWAETIDIKGGTPGRANSVRLPEYDLAIVEYDVSPNLVTEEDSILISTKILNKGKLKAAKAHLNFKIDFSIPVNIRKDINNLAPHDSITITQKVHCKETGLFSVRYELVFENDQRLQDNYYSKNFEVLPLPYEFGDIVINEIMYKPISPEPEWIELYNTTNDTVSFSNWKIGDASTVKSTPSESFSLLPNSYLILSDNENLTDLYDINVPIIAMNLPSLNNSGDQVKLFDSRGYLTDSVQFYSNWGGDKNGQSLERLSITISSNDSTNWGSSLLDKGGTPGQKNSITIGRMDLAVTEFSTEVEFTILPNTLPVSAEFNNIGTKVIDDAVIKIYNDKNFDGKSDLSELVITKKIAGIAPGSISRLEFTIDKLNEGKNQFILSSYVENEDDTTNNVAYLIHKAIKLNEMRGDILVNEIMYAPSSDEPEWLELFNASKKTINLKGYQLADASSKSEIVDREILLEPMEYFIVAKDSSIFSKYEIDIKTSVNSFPALNNTGDNIIIYDSLNRVIDSLEYSSSWGGKNGTSLEKSDPFASSNSEDNWGASIGMPTPGKPNTLTMDYFDIAVENLKILPEKPIIGDQLKFEVEYHNNGKDGVRFVFELWLDNNNIPDEKLFVSDSIFAHAGIIGVVRLDYTYSNLQSQSTFVVKAVVKDDQNETDNFSVASILPGYPVSSILINEVMFKPEAGEPEWVELVNVLDIPINLKTWKLGDVLSTPAEKIITGEDIIIQPNEIFVVAKDSSIINFHSNIPAKIIVAKFPNLNNTADGVLLKDINETVIDSFFYGANFISESGYSLERLSLGNGSNAVGNWLISTDPERSTPGRQNSILPKQYDIALSEIYFSPQYPIFEDEITTFVKAYNYGLKTAMDAEINFYVNGGFFETSVPFSIEPGDSVIISTLENFEIFGKTEIKAVVKFNGDEVSTNNEVEGLLIPGFEKKSIIISEFMYNPHSGEPEWIELHNRSEYDIDILGWQISDLLTKPNPKTIIGDSYSFKAGEYIVIANDSLNNFNISSDKIFIVKFGSLGNSGDGILLYDFRNAIIDSLEYDDSWGLMKGVSVERFNSEADGNNIENWHQSISVNMGTPGEDNSISDAESAEQKTIVINEIMANPNDDNSEFVEIINIADDFIDIGGWTLTDNSGKKYSVSDVNFELAPNEVFLFSSDSALLYNYSWLEEQENIQINSGSSFSLTNSGEDLILKDIFGNVIDSVSYSEKWHNKNISFTKNKSLERISPAIETNYEKNWSTSVHDFGATPGIQNSIFNNGLSSDTKLSVSPNPFSPDGDGFEDNAIINYNLTQSIAQIRVKIFDSKGRLVRTLENNRSSGAKGQIIFDGFDDNGKPLRIGIYILFIEALNNYSGVVEVMKEAVVIARQLN